MPKAVSKDQYRMMQAILHSGPKNGRQPPKYIAEKYTKPDDSAPKSKDNNRGGEWNAHHGHSESSDKEKDKKKKHHKKEHEKEEDKKHLKKSNKQGTGVIVLNEDGKILVGKGHDGKWQMPGGHVDAGETFDQAAIRELNEEANITAESLKEINSFSMNGYDSKTFLVTDFSGEPSDSNELKDVQFVEPSDLIDWNLRDVSRHSLNNYIDTNLKKSFKLKDMLAVEKLEKNILREGPHSGIVHDVTHGDALRLVRSGCFKWLKNQVKDMKEEDFKDLHLDTKVISIRKHISDVYSGRISDGHKVIHQFTNKSLPQLCADIMSVFEWYSDEDESVFDQIDNVSDDEIFGGLSTLTENYTKHNLANIYSEMEHIRNEIRHGNAVDLQQVEEKMMKLFDKLEETTHNVVSQHNKLAQDAGKEIEMLENKLKELASKIDELGKKPEEVEAYQTKPVSADKVYDSQYMYLAKPEIHVEPNGKIKIVFGSDWSHLDKSNFLNDMRAKIIRRN